MRPHVSFIAVAILCCHCGSKPDSSSDGADQTSDLTGKNVHVIDASDKESWQYFSLKDGEVNASPNPKDSLEWDLGFKRYSIKVNGGVSGPKDISLAMVESPYETAAQPEDGYFSDLPDGGDDGADPDYAFGAWYAYDPATHVLSPKAVTYFIRIGEASYRLSFTGYYNSAGTPGHIQFKYQIVAGEP